MATRLHRWTRLGLGLAVAGVAGLASCSQERAATDAETAPTADTVVPESTMSGEGEAGETGEGEGGVPIERAATDAVIYRAALAITEAHVIAARDAYAAGETIAAAEMFAHPVSEVLFDLEETFVARGVAPFDQMLTDAAFAASSGAAQGEIDARSTAIIAKLRDVARSAPPSRLREGEIAARVVADQIGRAADMHRLIQSSDSAEAYLDGYGFFRTAEDLFRLSRNEIVSAEPDAANRIVEALDLLRVAYPGPVRPADLPGDASAVAVADSSLRLALGN